jgi:hypothetical protein
MRRREDEVERREDEDGTLLLDGRRLEREEIFELES